MPSMSTLMGKRWFGALRSARRLSHLRSRAHFLRFPPMRAPGCGDARSLGKDALRCRVLAAVPARVSSAAVPSPDVPHSLPVLLDVSTVRAAVPLQLGDARVAQAHGGRLRSRTSSAEGVGAARAALQRARGERRDAPLSRWRCAVFLGYSPAHRSCARQSWRQAAIFGVLDISCSSYARASAGARRSVGVVSDASGAHVVLLSRTRGVVY